MHRTELRDVFLRPRVKAVSGQLEALDAICGIIGAPLVVYRLK